MLKAMEFSTISRTILLLLIAFIDSSIAAGTKPKEAKCKSSNGWKEFDESTYKLVSCKKGKCLGMTAIGKKGEKVGNFGCSYNEKDFEEMAPAFIERIQKNPSDVQIKMSMNHGGLSMIAQIKADKKLVSRIVSGIETGSLEKFGEAFEDLDVDDLGDDFAKLVIEKGPPNIAEGIEGVITPVADKIEEFTIDEELEINFNTQFSLKPQKGGEISMKVGLNGKTTPKKMRDIWASNEAALELCIGDDCVLMGMCSEDDCNKKAKFTKLAYSELAYSELADSAGDRLSIGTLMVFSILFIQRQILF